MEYNKEIFKKGKTVFTTSINNDPGFVLGCEVLINSIRKYHPNDDIIVFLESKNIEFEIFCKKNNVKVIYFDEKITWFIDVINSREDLLKDTTHYHHPNFKPIKEIPCPFDINNNDPGFNKIRHRHPLNFKAYCTGWCILHENYEYVCHIDSDAFLLSNISDIYKEYIEENCIICFSDNTDNLPNLEKLYNIKKTLNFNENKYSFNAGVVFYHNGENLKKMIEEFMFYIECPYHWIFSGTLCDQGILRALVAKYDMDGKINYHIKDKTNWNPIHGSADSLKKIGEDWINNKNLQKQYVIHTSTCKIWYKEWENSDMHKPWLELGGKYISRYNMSSLPKGCLNLDEINLLFQIIFDKFKNSENIVNILEIGTYFGRSAIGLGYLLREKGIKFNIDTVDTFSPSIDFPEKEESYNSVMMSLENFELSKKINLIKIHQGENLINRLKKQNYDVAFIDGEHQFSFVYMDCYYVDKLVKNKNSIIIGDDYGGQVKDAVDTYFINKNIQNKGKIWWFYRE